MNLEALTPEILPLVPLLFVTPIENTRFLLLFFYVSSPLLSLSKRELSAPWLSLSLTSEDPILIADVLKCFSLEVFEPDETNKIAFLIG